MRLPNVGTLEALTRAGFAARGVMYLLIGFLFLSAGRAEDGTGALAVLQGGWSRVLLAAMALGFAGYALWRLSEAVVDTEGNGSGAKGLAVRFGGAISGVVHIVLGFAAARLAAGGGGGGDGSREGAQTALGLPGGQAILAAAAALLAATGLYQLIKAWKASFRRHLEGRAAGSGRVLWLGRLGYAARGIVFLIVAWFFWKAARAGNAGAAGGMDEALRALPGTLQTAVAAGLFLFGLFSLIEARYRRIMDPRVLDRLKRAAGA